MILTNSGILLEEDEVNTRSVTGIVELPFDRLDRALRIAHHVRYDARSSIAVKYALKVMKERNDVCPMTANNMEKQGRGIWSRIIGSNGIYSTKWQSSKDMSEIGSNTELILHKVTNAAVEVMNEPINGGICKYEISGATAVARVTLTCEYKDILVIKLYANRRLVDAGIIGKIASDLKKILCFIIEISDTHRFGQYITYFHIRSVGSEIKNAREDEITYRLLKSMDELGIKYRLGGKLKR